MRDCLVLLVPLLVTGCSKKEENKPTESATKTAPTTSTPATPTTTPTPPTPDTTAAPQVALSCDKVLPQTMRDSYFKDATIKDDPSRVIALADASGAHCAIEGPVTPEMKVAPRQKTWTGSISVLCFGGAHAKTTFESMRDRELKMPDATPLQIGGAAIGFATGNNGSLKQVKAWDDNSTCQVHTILPKEIHKDDVAKDLIAALPLQP